MTTQTTRTIHGRPDWPASLENDRIAAEHVGGDTYWRGSTERGAFIAAHIGDLHVPEMQPGLAPDSGPIVGQLTRAEYEARTQAAGVRTVRDDTCEQQGRWDGALLPERDPSGRNTVAMGLAAARRNQILADRRSGVLPSIWAEVDAREARQPRCAVCGTPDGNLMHSSTHGAVCADCYDNVEE